MAKQLVFGAEARTKLKNGIDQLAEAVGSTLGPKGRNVVISKQFSTPHVTKDGVSVAKEVELEDQFENMGVNFYVKQLQKQQMLQAMELLLQQYWLMQWLKKV